MEHSNLLYVINIKSGAFKASVYMEYFNQIGDKFCNDPEFTQL